jgi:ribose-phosphate pyrophosphokinase
VVQDAISYAIFSGSSHPKLAQGIASHLSTNVSPMTISHFPDGEIKASVDTKITGKDLFIVQSLGRHPNAFFMELFIIVDALKRAGGKRVTAVIPYFGYARQDRKGDKQEPITARLMVKLLQESGVDRVITMDLHSEQMEGFFDISVMHIPAHSFCVSHIQSKVTNPVIVSPDIGRAKFAARFAEEMESPLAVIHKSKSSEGSYSGYLMGDVKGKEVLIVDDICSTGKTLHYAAHLCKQAGATNIHAAVTHGIDLKDEWVKDFSSFFVTDTLNQSHLHQYQVISAAKVFAKAIEQF